MGVLVDLSERTRLFRVGYLDAMQLLANDRSFIAVSTHVGLRLERRMRLGRNSCFVSRWHVLHKFCVCVGVFRSRVNRTHVLDTPGLLVVTPKVESNNCILFVQPLTGFLF